MIERLLAVLMAAELEPDTGELRDALWLARHITVPEAPDQAARQRREASVTQSSPPSPTTATARSSQEPAEATTGAELYAAGSRDGDTGYLQAMEVRSPAVPALRHQLPLARALKPFKRRVPSQTSFVVDEAATAARVAEEGIWLPVLRPAPARWLDLALVVDTSPSMVVWRRTMVEFRTIAERLGAFRNVRVLAVDASTDPSKPLTIRLGSLTGGLTLGLDREPATLIDPSRRQVILVVTDAVSGAWRDGRMDMLLRHWGAAMPVAVATVLPQRMWAGTGIRAVPARLHSTTPGTANGTLCVRVRSARGAATGAVPIPVMELSARWLGQWANVVAGAPDWRNAALLARPAAVVAPSPASPAGGSAGETVRRFRTAVSPTAFQLACYLSAAWLNLPVMRLVQQVMLPESDTAHLAEVFLSGLLRAVPSCEGMDPEIIQYDFLPQVRDELNNYLVRDEMLNVLRETSQFVAERFGQPLDFAALLADPESAPLPALTGEGGTPPLAYVTATVLAKLGGRYRSLANRLATAGPPTVSGGLAPASVNLSTPTSPAIHEANPGVVGRRPEEVGNLSGPIGNGVTQAEAPDPSSPDDAEHGMSYGDANSREELPARLRDEAAAARDEEAADKTAAVERQSAQLQDLLRSSLTRDPSVSLASLRRGDEIPPLDLDQLAVPIPAPQWEDFEPQPPRGLQRILGGQQRYEAACEAARQAFDQAQADHQNREAQRRSQVDDARQAHDRQFADVQREVDAHNAHIDEMEAGLRTNERRAVSEYVRAVLDRSPYPPQFPAQRSARYIPESSLLAVEWYLPPVEVVPQNKSFRHVKTRKVVEPIARSQAEVGQLYQSVIAQIALRTLREIFDSTPEDMISTVLFNGRVHAIDPHTGQKIQPHLITLRATRQQFQALVLDEPTFNAVKCVRRYFFADISPHPEELIPVEPVVPFSMADPRTIDPIDDISGTDKRPNLLELTPGEFEAFIQNLFTKMGFDTKLYQASGDSGIDLVAYDSHPITGGKFIIQAKLYTRTVQPTHVRDLWGTVQHEGATKGIMITTSGYGPDSYKFAGGKPLDLIDGSGLLALCQQYDIPARILGHSKRNPPPEPAL